jgi:membrane-bound serine protease (ClpP class)
MLRLGLTLKLAIIFLLLGQLMPDHAFSQESRKKIFTFRIDDNIDPRMNRRVKLALEEAKNKEADLIIIEMDTYGGAVNDADDIRTMILELDIPIYVFINKDAASAGALISIACDSIYMAPGASIGAATVVTMDGQAAPDKYQSYFRSNMRSTAEAKGRDPRIAEAMVDESIEIEGITKEGEVITFSTSEAMQFGYCEGEVSSIGEILNRSNIFSYDIESYEPASTEKIIAFFLNPVVSGLLVLIILGGLYFELQTPGVGFPLLAALIALILYFTPLYLNGLAAYWEIAVFIIGVVLLLVELFIIPGFGVAGISGAILILTSLTLMMLGNDTFDFTFVPAERIVKAITVTFSGLLASILVLIFGGLKFTQSRIFARIALQSSQKTEEGYTSKFTTQSLLNREGIAFTVLRPSGRVEIDGDIYEAVARDHYVEAGDRIVVIDDSGNVLKVKKAGAQ